MVDKGWTAWPQGLTCTPCKELRKVSYNVVLVRMTCRLHMWMDNDTFLRQIPRQCFPFINIPQFNLLDNIDDQNDFINFHNSYLLQIGCIIFSPMSFLTLPVISTSVKSHFSQTFNHFCLLKEIQPHNIKYTLI